MHRTPDQEYLKRVADILKKTGHPRQDEVLEDLRSHLEEVTLHENAPANLDALEERLGSPEEYAENLAPATGHQVVPLLHRRTFRMGAMVAAVIIVITVVAIISRHSVAAYSREALGKNFFSTPFFDLERMQKLEVGATADEIRDAIGYPLRRYRLVGSEHEVRWSYTALPSRYTPFYTRAEAITDTDEMNLIRLEISEHFSDKSAPEDRVIGHAVSSYAGTISFSRPDGRKLVLKPSDEMVYVLRTGIRVGAPDDLDAEKTRRREASVTASWKDVPRENIRFVYDVDPGREIRGPRFEELLKELPPESLIYSQWRMQYLPKHRSASVVFPSHTRSDPMIYSRGTLYSYPRIFVDTPRIMEAYRNDQNWLIHRLLSREN